MCVCSQVVGSRAVGSVSVRLGEARAAAQAELDGFRTRALRAEEGSQRPSYVSEWRCVEASAPVVLPSVSVIALGGGGDVVSMGAASVQSVSAARVVMLLPSSVSAGEQLGLASAAAALALAQAQSAAPLPPVAVWLLTAGVQAAFGSAPTSGPAHGGSWGVARSARTEALVPLLCADVPATLSTTGMVGLVLSASEPEVVARGRVLLVPRLTPQQSTGASSGSDVACSSESHAVTGGTSGIGLLTARWLAQRGVGEVVLASRRGAVAADAAHEWE